MAILAHRHKIDVIRALFLQKREREQQGEREGERECVRDGTQEKKKGERKKGGEERKN